MAWRGNLSKYLKEVRFLMCQTSPASSTTRSFVEKNYKELKTLNPKLPILIRECSGVEPQLWARYDLGVEKGIRLEGLTEEQISKALQDLMARVRDRTEDFKDAVRQSARSLGYDEAKLASVMASFIIHKPRQRLPFTKAALKTLESIGELDQFLLKHRKDYTDLHRTTEQERDSIEHEVSAFIKTCQQQIDVLKNSINDEEENSKGWLGIAAAKSNADTIAHKHGVVLILSERLHSVTAQFDQLRAVRFQDAINRAIPRRKLNRMTKKDSAEASNSGNMELRETDESRNEPLRVQQQLLDDETRALQVELTSLLDAVQETETKMVEMSALNHLLSTHVLQQAQQIELLYEQAVEATKNVVLGNKELSQAIQRNSSSRTFLLLFLFVLTFSVLFLDWYS